MHTYLLLQEENEDIVLPPPPTHISFLFFSRKGPEDTFLFSKVFFYFLRRKASICVNMYYNCIDSNCFLFSFFLKISSSNLRQGSAKVPQALYV